MGTHEHHESCAETLESAAVAYDPQLSSAELILEVRRLLATERRVERLICRYLADLADRIREGRDGTLWAYADEFHAARCFFGLGVRNTRERVRVGRALRQLPQVEAAFVGGELSYSRVREVTRVAQPCDEAEWLELAKTLDMRALERKVAAAREAHEGSSSDLPSGGAVGPRVTQPTRTEWLSQNAVRVTFELSAEAWGLLERALEGARRAGADSMTDAEVLVAVARDALSAQHASPDPAVTVAVTSTYTM